MYRLPADPKGVGRFRIRLVLWRGGCAYSTHVRARACDTRPVTPRGKGTHGTHRYDNANVHGRSLQDDFVAGKAFERERETKII